MTTGCTWLEVQQKRDQWKKRGAPVDLYRADTDPSASVAG